MYLCICLSHFILYCTIPYRNIPYDTIKILVFMWQLGRLKPPSEHLRLRCARGFEPEADAVQDQEILNSSGSPVASLPAVLKYLSSCLSICLSIYLLSICLYTYLYLCICLSIYLSICLPIYLSVCVPVYLPINHISTNPPFYPPICVSISLYMGIQSGKHTFLYLYGNVHIHKCIYMCSPPLIHMFWPLQPTHTGFPQHLMRDQVSGFRDTLALSAIPGGRTP